MITMRNLAEPKKIESFPFGKYQDQEVSEIVELDPNYIIWWNENLLNHPLDRNYIKQAKQNIKALERSSSSMWEDCFDPGDFWNN